MRHDNRKQSLATGRAQIVYISDEPPPAVLVAAVALLQRPIAHRPIQHLTALGSEGCCVIPVLMRDDLDRAFRISRFFRLARRSLVAPIVLINPKLFLPESVTADFEDLGCRVSFAEEPIALAQTLAMMHCIETRIRRHGPIITWDGRDMPVFHGTRGRFREVNLSAAEYATLKALETSRQVFSRHELAALTGYKPNEIQMFIQRLRKKFIAAGRWVNVKLSADSIIRTVRRQGYRLVARIRHPE